MNSSNKEKEDAMIEILYSDETVRWVHERYQRDNPQEFWNTPWEALPEAIKESNRNQVKTIPQKLLAIGYKIVLVDSDDFILSFTEDEMKILARIEHDRWMLEKVSEGWQYGENRDETAKFHPSIVPWKELPETEKQKNISTVKNIIPLLKKAGLMVVPF